MNVYLIYLRCTQESTIKRIVKSGGAAPDGKIHFPLITKGERFVRCRGQRNGSRGRKDHKDVEDRGMVLGGADLSNAEDKGMVPGGV